MNNNPPSLFGRKEEYRGVDNKTKVNTRRWIANPITAVGTRPKFSYLFDAIEMITATES